MNKIDNMIFYDECGKAVNVPPIKEAYDNGLTYVEVGFDGSMRAIDKCASFEQVMKLREIEASKGLFGIFFPPKKEEVENR